MNNQVKMQNKLEEVKKLREAFQIIHNKYVEDFNELNNKLMEQAKNTDELLGFMEKVNEVKEEKEE